MVTIEFSKGFASSCVYVPSNEKPGFGVGRTTLEVDWGGGTIHKLWCFREDCGISVNVEDLRPRANV
jgi:hypothetical protein